MGNGLNLGETVPDFTAESSDGSLVWHEYIKSSWAILFSHPGDFTPVCTTELGQASWRGTRYTVAQKRPYTGLLLWQASLEGFEQTFSVARSSSQH